MKNSSWLILLGSAALVVAVTSLFSLEHGLPSSPVLWTIVIVAVLVYVISWFFCCQILVKRFPTLSFDYISSSFLAGLLPLVINIPYLWYRSESRNITQIGSLSNQSLLITELIIGVALIITLLWLNESLRPSILTKIAKHPLILLAFVCVTWTVLVTTLAIIMHHNMQERGANTIYAVQALNNVFDSKGLLYSSVLQAHGSSLLGVHSMLIFFIIMPLYKIWPHYQTVLFLGIAAMAAGVFPMFLLARTRFSIGTSLIIALAYLSHPTIAGAAGAQATSELRFLPLLLLTSLLFFQKQRVIPFILLAILTLSIREDISLLFVLLGLYAVIRRKRWYWSVIPIVMGLGWLLLMTKLVIPASNPAGEFTRIQVVFEEFGGSQENLFFFLISHPWKLLTSIFSNPSGMGFIYALFQTTGFGIPLLSGLVVLASPALAENLLINRPSINAHHAILATIPLLVAFIFGAYNLDRMTSGIKRIGSGTLSRKAAILLLFSCLSAFHIWFSPGYYTPRYNYDTAREILNMLPDDATVVLPTYMLLHTQDSQVLTGYYQIAYRVDLGNDVLQENYIVIDEIVPQELKDSSLFQGQSKLKSAVTQSPDFHLIYEQDDLKLYVRNGYNLKN